MRDTNLQKNSAYTWGARVPCESWATVERMRRTTKIGRGRRSTIQISKGGGQPDRKKGAKRDNIGPVRRERGGRYERKNAGSRRKVI